MILEKQFNIGRFAAAALLAMALVLPLTTAATAEGEKPEKKTLGSFFSDAWISTRIETAYFFDRKINTFDVDVEVRNGIVHVLGYVPTEAKRDHALKMARKTPGVRDVVDKMLVDPAYKTKLAKRKPLGLSLNDYWTSRRVKAGLMASPRVRGTFIGVDSNDGLVTLRGSVFKPLESTAAEEIAAGMSGVKEVNNEILCCRM